MKIQCFLCTFLLVATNSLARDIEPLDSIDMFFTEKLPVYGKPIDPGPVLSLQPVARTGDFWADQWVQRWSGDQLEGSTSYCENNSYRQEPVTGFDINLDGYSEILLPISCYQGEHDPTVEKHNRAIRSAWRMFCSDHYGMYSDCTQQLFDANEIEATVTPDTGGIPYLHVADTGFDINNDGFPDFWFGLNRDDGRPALNPGDPRDYPLYDEYCGVPEENYHDAYTCTWKSMQSVMLSTRNSEGHIKYRIVPLPWNEVLVFDLAVLPNAHGTVDIFTTGLDPVLAARLTKNNTFVNVSTEYSTYKNFQAVMLSSPYLHVFEHENSTYLITPGIHRVIFDNPNAGEFQINDVDMELGFTLWKWLPGRGFEFSDYHSPDAIDKFTYRDGTPENYQVRSGAFLRDIPVFSPNWHFFDFGQLRPDEDPVLVIVQEADTTFGKHFKAPVDGNVYYQQLRDLHTGDYSNLIAHLSVVQGFYIRDGKIEERQQSVVAGDVVWNNPSFRIDDINRDGYGDIVATSGHTPLGALYLNDGTGTLHKLDTSSIWPFERLDRAWNGGYGGVIRNLGMAPYLHFLQFGNGVINPPQDWPEYADGYVHPDFIIRESLLPIDELPTVSAEQLQERLHQCTIDFRDQWFYSCFVF